MHISFKQTPDPEPVPSLAYTLGITGTVRWRELTACRLTYEEDDGAYVTVHVAEKRRYGTVSSETPVRGSVFGSQPAYAV